MTDDRRQTGRRWSFMDLVTEYKTGRLSETKLWANIGKAAMTLAFGWVIYKGGSSEWLWLAYGIVIVGHEPIAKLQNQRQQQLDSGVAKPTIRP